MKEKEKKKNPSFSLDAIMDKILEDFPKIGANM